MKYGDKGIEVQEMQEDLLEQGYALPIHGADGDFGPETLVALNKFESDRGWIVTGKGADVSSDALEDLGWDPPEDPLVMNPPKAKMAASGFYDLRTEAWDERNPKKFRRTNKGKPVIREPSQVTGITIHQTAAPYGVAPYQVKAAGGDPKLALARRALRVACHTMAFRDGFFVAANPLRWYVYHGNAFNSFELGLEIDGRYPGMVGGRTWNRKKPTPVTQKVIRAACAAIEWMVIEGRKEGMPIEYIHAHRQSSATRRDDPGEELWKRVVLDFCVPELGLKTEPARVLKNGRTIPPEWDPDGVGKY